MSKFEQGDFSSLCLKNGISLHFHQTSIYKSTTVDIFIRELLQPKRNTRMALLGRLLERGTQRWPDMQSMNRCVDEMYGASYAVDVEQVGDQQLIHLSFEVIDDCFLPADEDLLKRAFDFLQQILYHPVREGKGIRSDFLKQEKKALKLRQNSIFSDKMAYAHRSCVAAMCRNEPFGLSNLGEYRDFRGINCINLLGFHRKILAHNPIDVFISGRTAPERLLDLCSDLFTGGRQPYVNSRRIPAQKRVESPREVSEFQGISQGKLVLGYRTQIDIVDPNFPALVLFNALFGGDAHSRLFRFIREEEGLCYFIESQLEPLCGLLFLNAGIEKDDYSEVNHKIGVQLDKMRMWVGADELERVRSLMVKRLVALQDDREGLVRFYLHARIADLELSRDEFRRRLEAVRCEDISRVARKVELDTTFFVY